MIRGALVPSVMAATLVLPLAAGGGDAERNEAWKGERVRLMALEPGSPHRFIGGDGSCIRTEKRESLPNDQYAGRVGAVVEVTHPTKYSSSLIVELSDPAQRVVVSCSEESLGFFGEMEAARRLVGRSFWAKGRLPLVASSDVARPHRDAQRVMVKSTARATVTRVEWGDTRQAVVVCFRAQEGQEGCLIPPPFSTTARYHCDARFAVNVLSKPLESFFHSADPRTAHPKWSADTWTLIERGAVAVGMTREMAQLACGEIAEAGLVLESGAASTIMECANDPQRFLVAGDRVTKLVR